MPILIDGWNLIRNRRSDISDECRDALSSAEMLIGYLERFQQTHNDPVIIVFDSTNEFLGIDYRGSPKLRIVPAKNADDYIKRYIDKIPERQRRAIRVVSSDNDVYFYAKSSYATCVKCEEFWDKIKKDQDRRHVSDRDNR